MTNDQTVMEAAEETPHSTYRTKDLNQAAFIWCQPGAKMRKMEGKSQKGMTVFFIFDLPLDERDLAKLIIDYANKDTTVEPQEFVSRQDNLRDLLHGSLRNPNVPMKGKIKDDDGSKGQK